MIYYLPFKLSSDWAVYAIVLEMSGCRPLLYIGSTISVKEGSRKVYKYICVPKEIADFSTW